MLEHTAKPAVFRETSWHRDSSSQGHVQTITKRSPYTYRVKEKPFRLFSDLNFFSSISFFYSFCPCASIGEILYFWQGSRAGWAAGALRSLASVCVSSAWAERGERQSYVVTKRFKGCRDFSSALSRCLFVAGCLRNVLQPGALATAEIWEVPEFSLPLSFYTPPPRRLSHPHRNTPSPPVHSLSHSFSPHPFLLCWQIRSPPPFFR